MDELHTRQTFHARVFGVVSEDVLLPWMLLFQSLPFLLVVHQIMVLAECDRIPSRLRHTEEILAFRPSTDHSSTITHIRHTHFVTFVVDQEIAIRNRKKEMESVTPIVVV